MDLFMEWRRTVPSADEASCAFSNCDGSINVGRGTVPGAEEVLHALCDCDVVPHLDRLHQRPEVTVFSVKSIEFEAISTQYPILRAPRSV